MYTCWFKCVWSCVWQRDRQRCRIRINNPWPDNLLFCGLQFMTEN